MKNNYLLKEDLKLLIEENQMSLTDVALSTDVSERTIDNIISESENPSDKTLDNIYSFIYDNGYRLNKTKEEIFKESCKDIVLFHGSKSGIEEVTNSGSRENCDFGPGFYLGETYFQASSFIYDVKGSSIYSFCFNDKGLKIKKYDCCLEWMLVICYYRGMIEEYKNHSMIKELIKELEDKDAIIAPIADNKMFYIMRLFVDGDITDKQAIHSLASSGLGNQYVLKSKKSISRLKEIERLYLSTSERQDIDKQMEERTKEIETKLKLARREFRDEGHYIDEILV